jgi:hypothetical protein
MILAVVRKVVLASVVVLVVAAVPAYAQLRTAFPPVRIGSSSLATAGGGVVAGNRFVARDAAIVWNRKWNTLTLYLLWRKGVTCATLKSAVTRPGDLVQVYVTGKPRVDVGQPIAGAQVVFVTIPRDPKAPQHAAGLKQGAQLTFRSVDSHPGGVWHGIFKVATHAYANGKLYGYNGTFAAKWCDVPR